MALRRVLVTFGNGDCGRLGHGAPYQSVEIPMVVRALLDLEVASASAGAAHTVVVTRCGTVLTFGLNDRGQLGHSAGEAEVPVPQEVALPEPAVAVAAGSYHTLAVTESGAVWAWGCHDRGQLGLGARGASTAEPRMLTSLQGVSIAGVAAGPEHSVAVTRSGEVFSWGAGALGRLGHGAPPALKRLGLRDEHAPRVVRALETFSVRQVAAGHLHSAFVTDDGVALLCGDGRYNQLGMPADPEGSSVPRANPALQGVASIACGGLHTLAAQQGGKLAAWGANEHGCLGLGREGPLQARTPAPVPGLAAEQVSAGWKHAAAVTAGGRLYTWGWGGSQGTALSAMEGGSGGGQLGLGNEFDYWAPARVEWVQSGAGAGVPQLDAEGHQMWRVLQVACGFNHTAAVVEISAEVFL